MSTSIAFESVKQHVIPRTWRDQFIKWPASSTYSDIRNRTIGEVIACDRDCLPQVERESDFEFDV